MFDTIGTFSSTTGFNRIVRAKYSSTVGRSACAGVPLDFRNLPIIVSSIDLRYTNPFSFLPASLAWRRYLPYLSSGDHFGGRGVAVGALQAGHCFSMVYWPQRHLRMCSMDNGIREENIKV